jgi:centriolar protein POC1
MIKVDCIAEISGHQNPIYTVENSQKPHIFFTGGNDKGVVEWSLKTGGFVKVMMPVASSVYALHCPAFLPVLIAGERSGSASVFNFLEQKVTHTLKNHNLPVFDIQSVESKKEILLSSEDGTVSVWSAENFELVYRFRVAGDTVRVRSHSDARTM